MFTSPTTSASTQSFGTPGAGVSLPGGPMTIRGGGDPSRNMVIEPSVRMGPPPRSLAAEANDCFMVRPQREANRIQGCGVSFRAQMAGSPRFVSYPACSRHG
jgi:hypothetical protein